MSRQPDAESHPTAPRTSADASPVTIPPSLSQLFVGFLILGLTGFGGVLPLARDALVERRRWLTLADFTDLLGLCQAMPGGNIINLSVAVGMKFHGPPGAIAAASGLLAAPSAIVILLGSVYARFADAPGIDRLLAGLAAAAAGLIAAMAFRLAVQLRGKPASIAIAAATFAAIALARVPLIPAMLLLGTISVLVHWRLAKR